MSEHSSNAPVMSLRIGNVDGAVFEKTRKDGSSTWYSTSITTSYQADGTWKRTSNFALGDLQNVAKIADACTNWIVQAEQKARREAQ